MNPTRPQPVLDVTPADWLSAGVGPFGSGVGALLPGDFEAYARILHPATSATGRPVTWSTAAAWSGGTVHSRAQFIPMTRSGTGPPPWDTPPDELPRPELAALCDIAAGHTSTSSRCWFCVWEGHGWLPGAFSADVLNGPRVRLPQRDHLLLSGALDSGLEVEEPITADFNVPHQPDIFWPEDHAWCVATDVDLDSSYVGGTPELVADLLGSPRLEVWRCARTDPISMDGDEINGR